MNRSKLKDVLNILSPDGTAVDFSEFDKNVEKLTKEFCDTYVEKTKEYINWLEANTEATKEAYDEQKKKSEEDFRPFFIKLYEGMGGDNKMTPEQMAAAAAAAAAAGPRPDGMPADSGPNVEGI